MFASFLTERVVEPSPRLRARADSQLSMSVDGSAHTLPQEPAPIRSSGAPGWAMVMGDEGSIGSTMVAILEVFG